nr:TMEM165/GDT1 family protein [Spirulina subsalsa]
MTKIIVTLTEPLTEKTPEALISPETANLTQNDLKPITRRSMGFWATFNATFITILFAEMGDKTQLATLLMSAESQAPWIVFTGAAIALIATSLIGCLLGWWLAKRVSPKTMDLAAATILLVVSVLLLSDVVQL